MLRQVKLTVLNTSMKALVGYSVCVELYCWVRPSLRVYDVRGNRNLNLRENLYFHGSLYSGESLEYVSQVCITGFDSEVPNLTQNK